MTYALPAVLFLAAAGASRLVPSLGGPLPEIPWTFASGGPAGGPAGGTRSEPRGASSFASFPRAQGRQPGVRRAAVQSRREAYEALDVEVLPGAQRPSQEELKKAFRKAALRWHPDAPTGDAERFRQIREAYELLTGAEAVYEPPPSARSRRPFDQRNVYSTTTDVAGDRARREQERQERREMDEERRKYGPLVASVLGALVFIFVAVGLYGIVSQQPKDRPNYEAMSKREKALRFGGKRGMEYAVVYQLASQKGTNIPIESVDVADLGIQETANLLLGKLAEPSATDPSQRRYKSVTVVANGRNFKPLLNSLEELGEPKGVDDTRFPYFIFSGIRAVARFENVDTQQEILVVQGIPISEFSTYKFDFDLLRRLETRHNVDLVVFDVPEAQWRETLTDWTQPPQAAAVPDAAAPAPDVGAAAATATNAATAVATAPVAAGM